MDLWVVAAAAGAGYLAKYWQNVSGEKDGLPETSSWNLIHRRQSESPASNLLQQMRDSTCPLRRLARKSFDRDVSERIDSGEASEGVASTSGREWFQERINEKSEFFNTSGNVLYESKTEEISAFHGRIRRMTRSLRSRSSGYSVRPSTSLESCLVAQLYREHEKKEEHVFSSFPSSSTNSNRPLLLTDGRRKISRTSNDLCGASLDSGEDKLQRENGVFLEENDALVGAPTLEQSGLMEVPRKPRQRRGKSRLSSYSTELSGKSFLSQGPSNGMLLFFIGITIGIVSATVSNKREMDKLNELLKQAENLVHDLHEELEMKDVLTVKELANEGHQFPKIKSFSLLNKEEVIPSSEQLDESSKYDSKKSNDQDVELMSKIEAELEAELERLGLNMKTSSLERIADIVELDPDFEADISQGDLKLDVTNGLHGGLSDSDHDTSETNTNHTRESHAVSPRELSLRLHEVIESRLEAQIKELETALQDTQKRMHSLGSQHTLSWRGFGSGEAGSSSTPESPSFIIEGSDIDRPLVIDLSEEALDAMRIMERESG